MTAWLVRCAVLATAIVLFAPASSAQAPKVGDYYVDKTDLGFRVKYPLDWDLIPPQPGEPNIIAKFDPANVKWIDLSSDPQTQLHPHAWILKFDRRKKDEEAKGKAKLGAKPRTDILDWIMKSGEVDSGSKMKVEQKKEFLSGKIPSIEYELISAGDPKISRKAFGAQYKLSPDVDVALVFLGPGEPKRWAKWESACRQMLHSFSPKDLVESTAPALAADAPLRDKERARWNAECAKLRGGSGSEWKLYETPNYFVLTPHADKAFVDELLLRLEAIRAIYEGDYPAAKADELRRLGALNKTGGEDKAEKAKKASEEKMWKELFGSADPKELSKCSVVRVLTDPDDYHSYGGPGGSAGYWSPMHRELVIYDDQKGGSRKNTWSVLNHEAFHQYIFYFYGNISPHSWYNEGTGDFYSGYSYKNRKFTLEKFEWRVQTVQDLIREDKFVPLKDFVRFDQGEYYGNNKYGAGGGENYAQGWSVIYFLRTGKKNNAKGWNPAWDGILETYLNVLGMTGNVDQAVEDAYRGVDYDELEKAWKDYTL